MLQLEDVRDIQGMRATDPDGEKIGSVDTVYLDHETDQPEFALVNTGLLGTRSSFVPLDGARVEGDELHLAYSKDQVKDAPNIEADDEISTQQEAEIYRYYGRPYSSPGEQVSGDSGTAPAAGGPTAAPDTGREAVGYDTSGPTTDDAMTRSEEELEVTKSQRESGRVRLRKWVETEPVTRTVRTEREEARIEREPITEANVDEATSGPAISEEEHEVPLREEEAHVEKRAVPKERVRVEKDTVPEEEQVSDELRKERVEVEEEDR